MAATARYLDRPGGRVAYDIAGDGPLIVCAPGMGDLRSIYRFLAPRLVDAGFRVVTMDLRGHGDSDASFDAYDDVAAASDLVALAREIGGPAVLVGNSMGAGAAVIAAAEAPELVSGLVLIGPFVRDGKPNPLGTAMFRIALMRPWGRSAWLAYYPSFYPGRKPADLADHLADIRSGLGRPGHYRAFQRTTRTSHAPAEAALARVKAPALVVMGARDPDWPDPVAEAHWVAEQLDAELLLVPNAGHYPHAEYPEAVTLAAIEWLCRTLA